MTEEAPPPETQPTSLKRILKLLMVPVALFGLGAFLLMHFMQPPTTTIYASGYGVAAAADLPMPPGAELEFATFAEKADFGSGHPRPTLLLRVELLAGEKVVLVKECTGIGTAQAEPRTLTETTFWGDSCDLTVPEAGADLVQITPQWKEGGAEAKVSGLAFLVWVEED